MGLSVKNMLKQNEMNMTEGNLFVKLLLFSLPLMFTGILQLLYSAADLVVCGLFGSEHAVGAISSTNALINLIINLFNGLSVGANVMMARCYSRNDKAKGEKVMYTSMVFAVISGIILAIIGCTCSRYFLELMETTADLLDLSTTYLVIYFAGIPFLMIYNFGAALLRATGDTKRPFYFLAASGVINILLNLLFVIVFKMDVAGVAWATIISQAISALLVCWCLIKNKGFVKFEFKKISFHWLEAKEIIKIGMPAGFQGVIFSLSNVLIQSSIFSLGTNITDGNGAAYSLEGFVYMAMNAVAQASLTFVSANYAVSNFKNIKKVVIYACELSTIVYAIMGGFMLLLHKPLLSIYVTNEEAIKAGTERMFILISLYFLCGFMDIFAFALRGIGYSFTPMVTVLLGACGFRILWIYTIFRIPACHNLMWLMISYPISWAITALAQLVTYLIVKNKTYAKKLKEDEELAKKEEQPVEA